MKALEAKALKAIPLLALLILSGGAAAQEEPEVLTEDATEMQIESLPAEQPEAQPRSQTLLIQRVAHEDKSAWPARGQTMAEVETRFGAPSQKLEPIGGQKRQWPAIHRWVYPECTVYFEKNRVIDVVANKASAEEIGPKPPIK